MSTTTLKIVIAEPSAIICNGVETMLKRLPGIRVQVIEITNIESLTEDLRTHRPDILIINPSIPGNFTAPHLKEMTGCTEMKCLALVYTAVDHSLLRHFDDQISIFDNADELKLKLERLHTPAEEEGENNKQQTLSAREKEIVVCVVKGMTNREIADHLFLSTHTVITHRRNIARKLQVHSASALTVYAIVNKLVELKDINN
ncbi:MAG: response regulator transcription factor [Parabacteroides sp.]|nr:response regulator transcription factor [Parabacteroides sp.]